MLTTAARVSGLTVTVNNDSVWYLYNAFEVKESSIYFSVEQRDIKFMNNFTVLWGLNFLHQPVCRFTFCITLTSLHPAPNSQASLNPSWIWPLVFRNLYTNIFVYLFDWSFSSQLRFFSLIWSQQETKTISFWSIKSTFAWIIHTCTLYF